MSEGASVDYSNNGGWSPHLVMLGDCSIVVEHLPLQKATNNQVIGEGRSTERCFSRQADRPRAVSLSDRFPVHQSAVCYAARPGSRCLQLNY